MNIASPYSDIKRRITSLFTDNSGMAVVEFALVLPFLVALYIGGFQLMDGMSASRKLTRATRTIADLASQYTSVSGADLDSIISSSAQVMYPFPTDPGTFRVSAIAIDNAGIAKITWSRSGNGVALVQGTTVQVPTQFSSLKNTTLILSETTYSYVPFTTAGGIGTIPLKSQIFMLPRASSSIPCKDSSCA